MPAKLTREQWLLKLTDRLRPAFRQQGVTVPEVRVSCGFPSKRAFGKTYRAGECWSFEASQGAICEIFISPRVADPVTVGGVLVHELVHATVGVQHGHKAPFRSLATKMGLEGKMTSTTVGDDLREDLEKHILRLGSYPHDVLEKAQRTGPAKQTTRLLKVECVGCGCVIRMTNKWLEDIGPPTCACGQPMFQVV